MRIPLVATTTMLSTLAWMTDQQPCQDAHCWRNMWLLCQVKGGTLGVICCLLTSVVSSPGTEQQWLVIQEFGCSSEGGVTSRGLTWAVQVPL